MSDVNEYYKRKTPFIGVLYTWFNLNINFEKLRLVIGAFLSEIYL